MRAQKSTKSDKGSSASPAPPEAPEGTRAVLDGNEINRALTRIAHEVLERTKGGEHVTLLGVPSRGVPLAERLAQRIGRVEDLSVPVGSLDITMYRDDLRLAPARALGKTEIPSGGLDDRVIVLVDDVLFSGRTVRAALDALGDLGRPRAVQLAVLVDRGHRELPIRADYVGKNLPTSLRESVTVQLDESDGHDAVVEAAGGDLGFAEGPGGGQAQIVAVHRDVEGSDGDAEVLDPPDALGQALRERYTARGDAEEGDVFAALGAFEHLVGDAGQCPVDLVAVEDGPGAVGHLGWHWGSTGTRITFC